MNLTSAGKTLLPPRGPARGILQALAGRCSFSPLPRRVFLDRYVIYDGRLISVELIPAMMEDYSRPRPMTEAEKPGFLQEYFYYSGWVPLVPTPTPTITPTLTPMSIPPVSTATP